MIEQPVDVSFPVDRQVQESVDACFPYLRHGLRRPSVWPRACKFPKKVFWHGPGGGHSGIPQGRRTQELLRRWSFIFGHYRLHATLSLVLDGGFPDIFLFPQALVPAGWRWKVSWHYTGCSFKGVDTKPRGRYWESLVMTTTSHFESCIFSLTLKFPLARRQNSPGQDMSF